MADSLDNLRKMTGLAHKGNAMRQIRFYRNIIYGLVGGQKFSQQIFTHRIIHGVQMVSLAST